MYGGLLSLVHNGIFLSQGIEWALWIDGFRSWRALWGLVSKIYIIGVIDD